MKRILSSIIPFVLTIVAISCSKGAGDNAEFVRAGIEKIDVSCAKQDVEVLVESNASWTVRAVEGNGARATWITLSRVFGTGNASLTVSIASNAYVNGRTATLELRTTSGSCTEVRVVQAGNPDSGLSSDKANVRIGSYNLRITTGDKSDPDNNWTKRRPRVMQSIRDNAFDVFGVQECDTQLQKDLVADISDTYTCWFFSPYSQDGIGNKAQGIVFRTSMFTISDKHFFWNCDTPDVMTVNDISTGASYNRGGCCAVLTHKQTGIKLFFMVTHAALNDDAVVKYAHVFKDMEQRWNTKGYPCIFVGDMNAQPENPSSAVYREHWKDVYMNLTADKITGPYGTFNGFDLTKDMAKAKRIDFIYYRGSCEPLDYVCNIKKYDGFYASDHLPIYSNFTIRAVEQ